MTAHPRPPFAAKYRYTGWGITLIIIGSFFLLGVFSGADGIGAVVIGLGLITWAIYLLRGVQPLPGKAEREAIAQAEREATRQHEYEEAVHALINAKQVGRAAMVLAHRDAFTMAERWYRGSEFEVVQQMLHLAQIDPLLLQSNRVGNIAVFGGDWIEVFDDWIIWGRQGYDVDATTRGNVYVDHPTGPEQQVLTAQVSVASSSWSFSAQILHEAVYEARRIFDQLEAHIETRKQYGISHADIQAMIEVIRKSTHQTDGEKIRDLSKLRYEWLLSDGEFEQARQQILGSV